MSNSGMWINGRTLSEAIEKRRINSRFKSIRKTERIPLDLCLDSYTLGVELEYGLPFVIDRDLMVTIHDFDLTAEPARFASSGPIYSLPNLRFTRGALDSAISEFIDDRPDNETLRINRFARTMDLDDLAAVREFTHAVCVTWGRGDRVWGKLNSLNSDPDALLRTISKWLGGIRYARTPAEALQPGIEIKGLGVSFASKHLRLFEPERFATLDQVIELGFGYGRNSAGYNLWIHDLQRLKSEHQLPYHIGDLESGLFTLVRQFVRGKMSNGDPTATVRRAGAPRKRFYSGVGTTSADN